MEDERRRAVGLFRYALIREAADPALGARERGVLVRRLAARDHLGPDGGRVRVSRPTLDRWIRAWRAGGYAALVPPASRVGPRTDPRLLALACQLKAEAPKRTAAQIAAIIAKANGSAPTARTIQRHFVRTGLNRRPDGRPVKAFGRFEAAAPNELWTGDALHGPTVAGRKAYLFAFIDDHSRTLVGYRWGLAEDTLRLEAALRAALAARGVPKTLYVDNGAAFVSSQLARACAVLGIRLTHSPPGEPQGRGKIERVFATVRGQFLVEVETGEVAGLEELNRLFAAWVETVYHRRAHRETGQAPLTRFLDGLDGAPPATPTPAQLREAFLWSATRTVTRTATVSLTGNRYEVDPALAGCVVELVFDPFDLTTIEVRHRQRPMGQARPHTVRRHVHPAAVAGEAPGEPVRTGIDHLALLDAEHTAATRRRINYTDLPAHHDRGGDQHPAHDGQPDPAGDDQPSWDEPPPPFPDHDHDTRDDNDDGPAAAAAVTR